MPNVTITNCAEQRVCERAARPAPRWAPVAGIWGSRGGPSRGAGGLGEGPWALRPAGLHLLRSPQDGEGMLAS